MRIIVASRNPVKVEAARQAFASLFPERDLVVESVSVGSGVSDQPMSDVETRSGARNRAVAARDAVTDADFWVGMEGGIEVIDDQLMAFAWMVVGNRDSLSEARSVTLPLPPAVRELVDEGLELGDANDRVFSTVNSKQGGGAYGLLTDGRYTRESVYSQTLIIALTPYANPLYPQSHR
ncbi:MAG: inosine/xanthosine triphosphatase [Woeseiaceae bacterium]|nr:inosine/xanthosine triphosphatase [Woeseiaceae bacterium]